MQRWREADTVARAAIDRTVDEWESPFEGRVARDVMAAVPEGATLVVASSMPVRDLETFAAPRSRVRVVSNRGANGIDGFVSTALGVAAGSNDTTVALLGDLCFLHDSNGLLGASSRGLDMTFVVVDNDGGGIFSFLPQAELPGDFERLFGTPHHLDLAALAHVHGLAATEIRSGADVGPVVAETTRMGGTHVVVVRTDRVENVARHRAVFAAVADALVPIVA
jgi:2-succinyl-5-enolpyruvyl-6-hydroxy-3-cyclohexene-1-carboxylate synthase